MVIRSGSRSQCDEILTTHRATTGRPLDGGGPTSSRFWPRSTSVTGGHNLSNAIISLALSEWSGKGPYGQSHAKEGISYFHKDGFGIHDCA
eukprot:g65809.t1